MESYKKVLKKRIRILSICMVVFGAVITYDQFFAGNRLKDNDIYDFQIGMIVGLVFIGAAYIFKTNQLLTDEKKLRIAYNDENDERLKTIHQKSGLPVILYTSIIMLVAGIIAGYFNIIVFYTLVAAAIGQMLIAFTLKMIYIKRM